MKPSVLIAAGCSWVAGRAIDTDPTRDEYEYKFDWVERQEDPEFVRQHNFAGILQRQLGLDELVFVAKNGSNNEQQARDLVSFIDLNYNNYSNIFVIWGITTIYRWNMYSTVTGQVESIHRGRVYRTPEQNDEVKNYFTNFWNETNEVEKLAANILTVNGYLKALGIDHLIFNSFSSYTGDQLNINHTDNLDFYKIQEPNIVLLSMLCLKNDIPLSKSSVPFINFHGPKHKQFNNYAVKALQKEGWLDRATAHPTVKAHRLIADELYEYIKEKQQ